MKEHNPYLVQRAAPQHIIVFIKKLGQPVFTTRDIIAISGKSSSNVVQCLNRLVHMGLIIKIYHGVWAQNGQKPISPFEIIPSLFPRQRAYVSFITALHLYGIVEQIPQVITLASPSHSRIICTAGGDFSVHQIAPAFFDGFDWYRDEGSFLIAEQEKAFIDSLYLSSRKKNQFGHFPETHFPSTFSFKKALQWVKYIPEEKIQKYVFKKLEKFQQ